MARGQSKTPAEKATEAVEAQTKTVEKLRKDVDKLQSDIDKARETLRAASAELKYEKEILDVLKKHPALGAAPSAAEPVSVVEEAVELTGDAVANGDLVITRGVETPKSAPKPDPDGDVRKGMFSAVPPVEEDNEPAQIATTPAPQPRQPWGL